uniref:Protein kinase domain-containing protein n=1 Tax=Leersia perrieri TaxID=77586 RepID=A0A0D9VSM5_9ORYZ
MAIILDMLVRLVVVFTILFASVHAYTPADNYLILCGTSGNATVDGRTFVGDAGLPSSVLSAPQSTAANTSASQVTGAGDDAPALYQSARVFTAPATYTFAVKPGRHFVRLRFFPFRYDPYDLSADAAFMVSVQGVAFIDDGYTPKNGTAVLREFSVNVAGGGALAITFTPTGGKRVAFVNAIEVVSHPDELIADTANMVNPRGNYAGLTSQALETVHRINMGEPKVTPNNDTLWRTWLPDRSFQLESGFAAAAGRTQVAPSTIKYNTGYSTSFTAPVAVYATATALNTTAATVNSAQFNLTWQFDAPAGSAYLIRFHFCDIVSKTTPGLAFNVYVGERRVLQDFELADDTFNLLATPVYKDFVLSGNDVAKGKIAVRIGSSTLDNALPGGFLNGLEIMRMVGNTSAGASDAATSPRGSKIKTGVIAGSAVGGATLAMALGFVAVRLLRRKKKKEPVKQPSNATWTPFSASALGVRSRTSFGKSSVNVITLGQNGAGAGAGYRFPFAELHEATGGFEEEMVIGVGGFGKVYRGTLRDGTQVAVKRGNRLSKQGLNEFRTEIELLSQLRHRHLVSLIGYCDERGEMILVYEYMARGTLRSHLYGSDQPPLPWKQRLEACIGAARGLHYLHTGSAKAIIHRDVKSANILLDDVFMAKVADFGLSKTGPELDKTHVSTAVKGSFGYLDPEYFRRQMLTEKSDVYSFGVVLLEVLCARAVIDPTLPREMVNLAEWATKRLGDGELDQIVDKNISDTIQPDSLRKFAETAEKCLAEYGVERPAMGDVLWCLEYALQLQVASPDSTESEVTNQVQRSSSISSVVTDDATITANLGDLDGMSMKRVFSRMLKSEEGR